MKYELHRTSQFKKDFKLISKRGWDLNKLKQIVNMLMNNEELPQKCKPHKLSGNWSGYTECHVDQDWLLVYDIDEDIITLYRTGSHSDIF